VVNVDLEGVIEFEDSSLGDDVRKGTDMVWVPMRDEVFARREGEVTPGIEGDIKIRNMDGGFNSTLGESHQCDPGCSETFQCSTMIPGCGLSWFIVSGWILPIPFDVIHFDNFIVEALVFECVFPEVCFLFVFHMGNFLELEAIHFEMESDAIFVKVKRFPFRWESFDSFFGDNGKCDKNITSKITEIPSVVIVESILHYANPIVGSPIDVILITVLDKFTQVV
jgi:hypothetical protein